MNGKVCAACQREMYPDANGVYVIEHANSIPGPYKIYIGDLWACRTCGAKVVVDINRMAIAEHWQTEFKTLLDRAREGGKSIECYEGGGQTELSLRYVEGNVIGLRVRALRDFVGVAKGTEGVIDATYDLAGHKGIMVAWDLPGRPLPAGYKVYDGRPAVVSGLLRDGFGEDETEYLEVLD